MTDSQISANDHFVKNKYIGDRTLYRDFTNEVLTVIRGTEGLGQLAIRYLTTTFPLDAETGEINFPPEFTTVDPPVMMAADEGTPEERKENYTRIRYAESKNEKLEKIKTKCYSILSERVITTIVQTWGDIGCQDEPNLCWRNLRQDCSDRNMSDMNRGAYFLDFLTRQMKPTERFSSFIRKYNSDAELIDLPEMLRLGLLMSDGNNKAHIQMLPDRLKSTIRSCRDRGLNYVETSMALYDQDELQWNANPGGTLFKNTKSTARGAQTPILQLSRERKLVNLKGINPEEVEGRPTSLVDVPSSSMLSRIPVEDVEEVEEIEEEVVVELTLQVGKERHNREIMSAINGLLVQKKTILQIMQSNHSDYLETT
eukprot:gene42545-56551_t